MATQRILDFLATRRPAGPCLVVDLDVVRDNFRAFEKALPDSRIYYAVKANPAPEILRLLASMGSSFDTASVAEVEMARFQTAPEAIPDEIAGFILHAVDAGDNRFTNKKLSDRDYAESLLDKVLS